MNAKTSIILDSQPPRPAAGSRTLLQCPAAFEDLRTAASEHLHVIERAPLLAERLASIPQDRARFRAHYRKGGQGVQYETTHDGRLFGWQFHRVQGSDQAAEIVARGRAIETLRIDWRKGGASSPP